MSNNLSEFDAKLNAQKHLFKLMTKSGPFAQKESELTTSCCDANYDDSTDECGVVRCLNCFEYSTLEEAEE